MHRSLRTFGAYFSIAKAQTVPQHAVSFVEFFEQISQTVVNMAAFGSQYSCPFCMGGGVNGVTLMIHAPLPLELISLLQKLIRFPSTLLFLTIFCVDFIKVILHIFRIRNIVLSTTLLESKMGLSARPLSFTRKSHVQILKSMMVILLVYHTVMIIVPM